MIDSAIPGEHDEVLHAVHMLLNDFVDRQVTVYNALCDLAPHWLMAYDGRSKTIPDDEWQRFVIKCQQIPRQGHWGDDNEWTYEFITGGCQLSHTKIRRAYRMGSRQHTPIQ